MADRQPSATLQSILKDRSGNVLMLTAGAVLVLAAMVGGGVDMSRAYKAKNRLQIACDAGTLAGRRAVTTNGYDETARSRANRYFNVNFSNQDQDTHDTTFATSSPDGGRTVEGRAQTTINMVIMNIFGFRDMDLATDCSATMGIGNADVTMVLDTTGSMLDAAGGGRPSSGETSKMQDLKAAMKSFYQTLANASIGSNARIRYAFVPYTHTVNDGRLLVAKNANFLKASNTLQSRELVSSTAAPTTTLNIMSTGSYTRYTNAAYTSSGCNSVLPQPTPWVNSGNPTAPVATTRTSGGYRYDDVSTSQSQTRTVFRCQSVSGNYYIHSAPQTGSLVTTTTTTSYQQYAAVSFDMRSFNNFQSVTTQTGNLGANVTSQWAGCIEERESTPAESFSYSSLLGVTPDAHDLDIDAAPDPGDPATQWSAYWPNVAFTRTDSRGNLTSAATSQSGYKYNDSCPRGAQLLASMTQSAFYSYADSLTADGATYHDIGMVWGARLSSPDGIWSSNVTELPINGATVSRHIIFMTDGMMATNNDLYSAWGIEFHDRRVTSDGSVAQSNDRHNSRLLALCEATRAKGIRIWVVAFGIAMTPSLQACASDQSAFTAANAAQLNAAFQEIAKQVGELRVIQ